MGTPHRILKNSVALSLSIGLERGAAFFLAWYIAHVLGKEAMGEYGLAMAFAALFGTLAYFGLDQLVPREVARNRSLAGLYVANAGLLGGVASALFAGMLMLTANLLGYPVHTRRLLYIIAVFGLLFNTEATISEATIKGLERMEWIAAVRFLASVLRVGLSVLLLSLGLGLEVVFIILAAYQALVWGSYLALLVCLVPKLCFRFDWGLCWSLLKKTTTFMTIAVLGVIFRQIDKVMLSKIANTEAVGIYATGALLVQMVYMMAPALMEALFPRLSQMFLASPHQFARLAERSFKLIFIGIVPVVLCISAFAEMAILRVFGTEYTQSVVVLQILAWALIPAFTGRLLYRIILAGNNEQITMRVAGVNSVVNVLLNLLLIPLYGAVGTSVAAALTESLGFAQNFWFVSRKMLLVNIEDMVFKPMLCSVVSIAMYWGLAEKGPYLALLVALVVFAVALLASGTLSSQELVLLRVAWNHILGRGGRRDV
jgi:O-antigen/teichoic acid export membrane protein